MNQEELFVRLYFSVIDRWLFDPKKQHIAHVYIYLCRRANIYKITECNGIKIFPWTVAITQQEISKKLNIGRQKVRSALQILEENKLIIIDNETAKNQFQIIKIRVLDDQKTNLKNAETLDNTEFEQSYTDTKNQPSSKKTNQKTNQRADTKTAETLAAAAFNALNK